MGDVTPSASSAIGSVSGSEMSVMSEKRLILSSGFRPPIRSLLNTLRLWNVRLEPIADRKPSQLNVASDADASATPPTMGASDKSTRRDGRSPKKAVDKPMLNRGSRAFTVWVKETATLPRLTLVSRLPAVCTVASGRSERRVLLLM